MNIWIRSQEKERLIKSYDFYIEETIDYVNEDKEYDIYVINSGNDDIRVGTYKSKERALKVLDSIQSCMTTNSGFDLYSRTGFYPNNFNKKYNYVPIFQMPKE